MDSDQGKLFVGGISRETTEAILKDHFSRYGNVMSSVVAKDRNTKTPRGFGFVLFSEPSSADKALQDTHVILGRTVEVKKAIPRSEQHQNQQQQQQLYHNPNQQRFSGLSRNCSDAADSNNQFRTKKIFVGGLSASLTEEEFKNYFERFGRITDVVVMHDSSTNRPRGFGFVTFESEESVENVMQKSFHELNNRLVEVKRAVPKEGNNGGNSNHNMKAGVVRGSLYNGFQPVEYASNSPGYGIFPGYAPLPGYDAVGGYVYGTGVYGSGYPTVVYGRFGYGVTPATPRSPLYAPVMLGARVCPLPYGGASIYPTYMNGGVGLMGTVSGVYNGIIGTAVDGKHTQVPGGFGDLPANAIPPQIEGVNLDSGSLGLKERSGGASSEQDQNGLDGQLKPLPVAASR
ncbi:PREDICTED: RNA-binding protein 1 [Theobroma cacao]|uniref:RNA-binding protein 1 n=1 Tax=Theobroma cacao TaxID=3641 RepID=A0AB32WQ60_THECC|nr:PREDICTED: RNA-binding protein 1 [Theobroma cacao]